MPETPILVGVADIINRNLGIEHAASPHELMLNAITLALHDTGLTSSSIASLQSEIDSIDVVRTWTWPYDDLPALLAEHLNITPTHKSCSPHAGNQPAKLLDEAARRIARGESKVAVITGGEALASLSACAKAGVMPPPNWPAVQEPTTKVFSPSNAEMARGIGAVHGIGAPIQVYPLYENGLRAKRKQSLHANNIESAKLYAAFARTAKLNPLAWHFIRKMETEETISRVSERNRMICFPYPLLMNAFNTINLSAAVVLTSTTHARKLNIPQEKWIYVLGGAGTQDSDDFWQRPNFYSSPSISRSLDAGLEACGLTKADIDVFDFYSCFPIVPKLACLHLGLDILEPQKPITLLGGLTSFGGAGNNYSMHAITEMTRQFRAGKGKTGLVLANGGVLTYQHAVCLSSQPRADGKAYPEHNPLPAILNNDMVPPNDESPDGEAVIETYTVDFDRENKPVLGHVVGRLKSSGNRFIANHGDVATLKRLASSVEEPIGKTGIVCGDSQQPGRSLFFFDAEARL